MSAARWIAWRIRRYVAQRQMLPPIAASICASVGFGVFSRRAAADINWPAWQYPHCGTSSSSQARCTGCVPSSDSPSIVVTSLPWTVEMAVVQLRVGLPFTWTVQAPQNVAPQPNFVPLRLSSSRSTQRRGMSGGTSTVVDFPFNLKVVFMAGSWRVVLSDRGQVYALSLIHISEP